MKKFAVLVFALMIFLTGSALAKNITVDAPQISIENILSKCSKEG